jgi:hypothetical protein
MIDQLQNENALLKEMVHTLRHGKVSIHDLPSFGERPTPTLFALSLPLPPPPPHTQTRAQAKECISPCLRLNTSSLILCMRDVRLTCSVCVVIIVHPAPVHHVILATCLSIRHPHQPPLTHPHDLVPSLKRWAEWSLSRRRQRVKVICEEKHAAKCTHSVIDE